MAMQFIAKLFLIGRHGCKDLRRKRMTKNKPEIEAGELLQYGYPNSVIAARTGLSEREVEDIRQIKQIFEPVYVDGGKKHGQK